MIKGQVAMQCEHTGQRANSHFRWDAAEFHHPTQEGAQFRAYELFISGIFHLIFSDHS